MKRRYTDTDVDRTTKRQIATQSSRIYYQLEAN